MYFRSICDDTQRLSSSKTRIKTDLLQLVAQLEHPQRLSSSKTRIKTVPSTAGRRTLLMTSETKFQ